MPRLPLLISLLTVRALFGQSSPVDPQNPSPNSVVQVKRTPAAPASCASKYRYLCRSFRFRRERSGAGAVNGERRPTTGAIPAPHPRASLLYPRVTTLQPTSRFPTTAQQAVEFSASWRAQQNGAAPGPDGRVLFAFGAGLADRGVRTVACLPDRTAARRETCRRAADWRFGPMERGAGDVRQRRRKHRHARAETANAGPRYEPLNHD